MLDRQTDRQTDRERERERNITSIRGCMPEQAVLQSNDWTQFLLGPSNALHAVAAKVVLVPVLVVLHEDENIGQQESMQL